MRDLLPLLPKPSRYLGIEEGSVLKNAQETKLRVALAFPDMYEVGMSYLGQKILYSLINEHAEWWAERVFTPDIEAGKVLKERKSPLCTLESDTPLTHMDVVGISVTHELCYTNCLYLLDLANIPLRSAQRTERSPSGRPWPLVIAGGGCTLSAEPLAPFMDIMVLGEGEESFPELLTLIQEYKEQNYSRKELLLKASRIPGVYIPEFFEAVDEPLKEGRYLRPLYPEYTEVTRRIVADVNNAPYPYGQYIPFGAVHNRLALEIGRGCTRGCRFCQAGSLYRPARERTPEQLRELMESCLSSTGYDEISFLSLSTGDYSALKELFMSTVDRCSREQISVSLPSLRVGSIDDAIMERMAGIRRTGATLAPEAGTQRLRDVINKGISEEELVLHVQKLFEHGWQQVKLYFMIGLPTETDEDLLGIVDLCRKARDAAGPGIKKLQITAAISPFVPKPHTPFQWEQQIPYEEIRRRVGVLLDAVKQEKRIKMRWHEPAISLLEGIFSRGDRRLADVVESAFRKGAIFPDWYELFSLAPWLEAMTENNLNVLEYTRARDIEEPLPWDHLQSGLSHEFFLRERKKAITENVSPDCRYNHCNFCGVCDTAKGPSMLNRLSTQKDDFKYKNILNNDQRDQDAHTVPLDEYGRVIVRQGPYAKNPEANEEPGKSKDKTGKSKPPAIAPHLAIKAVHLRFWYARKDKAAYLSQLELQNIFERSLRRANLPLAFSQGFHPIPLISFGRALPVGVESECEWFSVYLREERPLEGLAETMLPWLPRGVSITEIQNIPLEKKSADSSKESYLLECLESKERKTAFRLAWEKISVASAIPWQKESKKGIRELDARRYFEKISLLEDGKCTMILDWENGYISPLALCRHALHYAGYETELTGIRLTKTQI